ncbi:Hypothetical predicted protein [Paramuricea clavata]|uniref:Uncharacterized protein n=1 Tax=Paramuricea clavata TaxID=317549 RepID=A0A7D9LP42_PARCT|nr:Hypothetical predicted protein [Paramuricea clavata]
MSRRLRSPLSISQRKLNQKLVNRTTFHAAREQQQQRQRKHYDRTANSLPPLEKGDTVRFKKDLQAACMNPWDGDTKARSTTKLRNKEHLRKTREHQADLDTSDIDDPQDPIPQPTTNAERNSIQIPIAPNPPQLKTSRYGRRINQNPNYKT